MPAARHDKAWRVMVALAIEQANMIADAVEERRTLFPDEPLRTSLLVVLLNIFDRFAPVACVRCDWHGIKHEANVEGRLPMCPRCAEGGASGMLMQSESRVVLGFGPR